MPKKAKRWQHNTQSIYGNNNNDHIKNPTTTAKSTDQRILDLCAITNTETYANKCRRALYLYTHTHTRERAQNTRARICGSRTMCVYNFCAINECMCGREEWLQRERERPSNTQWADTRRRYVDKQQTSRRRDDNSVISVTILQFDEEVLRVFVLMCARSRSSAKMHIFADRCVRVFCSHGLNRDCLCRFM